MYCLSHHPICKSLLFLCRQEDHNEGYISQNHFVSPWNCYNRSGTVCIIMIRAVSCFRTSIHRHLWISSYCFGKSSNAMESSTSLDSLSKEELIATVHDLRKKCDSLRAESSKYEFMSQKFQRISFAKRKKLKIFDPKTTPQRKIALKVCYFGWDYDGLQDNPGLSDTIEKILLLALSHTKLLVSEVEDARYSKCGRTDKGVSAFSQVFCLSLRSKFPLGDCKLENVSDNEGPSERLDEMPPKQPKVLDGTVDHVALHISSENNYAGAVSGTECDTEFDYCHILNRVLPKEIKVIGWAYVNDPDFSARHQCVGRTYKYYFPKGSLDIQAMNAASKKLVGTHDFRNFCKINVGERLVYIRELRNFKVESLISPELDVGYNGQYQMCVATIDGTGFLYHQVRYMMSVLILIGMGLEDACVIDDLLDIKKTPRRPQYGLCSEYPLVLYDCKFENLKWNTSENAEIRLYNDFRRYWVDLAVKAALARSMLEKFTADSTQQAKLKDFYDKEAGNNMSGILLRENWSTKQYRKIMTRQTASSLEERIEHMENKRKRKLERMEDCDV